MSHVQIPELQPLSEVVATYIKATLDKCNWHMTDTAKILEIDRKTLYRKVRDRNLQPSPTCDKASS